MALGRVYKRNEIWWVAFSYQGKEYRRSANTKNKRQAEQVLAFFLGQMARGEFKGFQQDSALMFYEMLDDFLADLVQRGRRYLNMATVRSRHLKAFFPDGPVEEITERRIDLYIKHRLALGRKRSTVDNEMQHLGIGQQ